MKNGRDIEATRRICGNASQSICLHTHSDVRPAGDDVSAFPFLFRGSAQPLWSLLVRSH